MQIAIGTSDLESNPSDWMIREFEMDPPTENSNDLY